MLSSNRYSDAKELIEQFDGIGYDFNSCLSIYNYVKDYADITEDIIYDDYWGVSNEEFEKHLYDLSLDDDFK